MTVGVSGGRNLTDFPHLRQGSSKCQLLLSEDWKEKSAKPTKCRDWAEASDYSELRCRP